MRMRRYFMVGAVMAVLGLAVGCGGQHEQEVLDTATRFAAAATQDPEMACTLLAQVSRENLEDSAEAPCEKALMGMALPMPATDATAVVQGRQALVKFATHAVFLSLYDDGWKVTAAGCQRTSDDVEVPWDCEIEGN